MKPVPGKNYTVVKGDTLWDIAGAAYGNPRKWRIIYSANKANLRNPKIYPNNIIYIYPGEILFIPLDGEKEKLKNDLNKGIINDVPGEKLRFVINGIDIDVISGRAVLCIDTLADAFSFSVDSGNAPHVKPFEYTRCDVYVDDTKIITGLIFKIKPKSGSNGEIIDIEGFSATQRIVSSKSKPPYLYRDKTLKQILSDITEVFSTRVTDSVNDTYRFKKAKIEYSELIGSFITKLSGQRQVLLKSTDLNEIEIIRANISGKPIVTISEDSVLVDPISPIFDGTKRHSDYIALGKNPKKNIKGTYQDKNIGSYSLFSDKASEVDSNEVDNPAEWFYRRSFIESVGLSFKIDGFYNSDNELIRENNIVSIEKKALCINPGSNFLIRCVEFEQSSNGGKFTTVEFTLPEVYTNEPINEDWGYLDD